MLHHQSNTHVLRSPSGSMVGIIPCMWCVYNRFGGNMVNDGLLMWQVKSMCMCGGSS